MPRPPLEVADLIRAAGTSFYQRSRKWFTWLHLKILTAIVSCRTSMLGGHIDECSGCGHRAISFNSCLMGSNSLWGVEERLSGRSKLFSLIQAVVVGCRLPITNRPFCGWDPQIAMR